MVFTYPTASRDLFVLYKEFLMCKFSYYSKNRFFLLFKNSNNDNGCYSRNCQLFFLPERVWRGLSVSGTGPAGAVDMAQWVLCPLPCPGSAWWGQILRWLKQKYQRCLAGGTSLLAAFTSRSQSHGYFPCGAGETEPWGTGRRCQTRGSGFPLLVPCCTPQAKLPVLAADFFPTTCTS